MSNEELEVMNEVTNDSLEVMDNINPEEVTGSGKVVVGVIAGLAAVAAIGAVTYKKIKAKNDGTPKKKKKLMWVEVGDEKDVDDSFDDEENSSVDETENE